MLVWIGVVGRVPDGHFYWADPRGTAVYLAGGLASPYVVAPASTTVWRRRIAHVGLHGPAMTFDTACSSV